MRLSRRQLLAAAAASALPYRAFGQSAALGDVDVAIVGAGAAGIAAARRIADFNRSYVVLEALDRPGGRVLTNTGSFAVPCDVGASRLYAPARHPLVPIARANGLEIRRNGWLYRLRIGRRDARGYDAEEFAEALAHAHRAIVTAGEQRVDMPADRALPDSGEWRRTVEFQLGPGALGKDLAEVSAADYARADEHLEEAYCRQGIGTIVAFAALALNVQYSTPVNQITWWGSPVALTTPRGTLRARTVIVTASAAVMASNTIRFRSALPTPVLNAYQKLTLGSLNHVVLELRGNPLQLRDDETVIFKAADAKTLSLRGRVCGSDLALVTLGGPVGAGLERAGADAMIAFATEVLAAYYGADIRRQIGRSFATRWGAEPTIGGAISVAAPGAQVARRVLGQPLENRLFLAGEATHETLWGTIEGAWQSGERAAEQALRSLGVNVPLPAAAVAPAPRAPQAIERRRLLPRSADLPERD